MLPFHCYLGVGMVAGILLLAIHRRAASIALHLAVGIVLRLAAGSLEGLDRKLDFEHRKAGLGTGLVIEALVNIIGWDRNSFLFLINLNDYNRISKFL